MGNPFLDKCCELLVLETQNCVNEDVIMTIPTIDQVGAKQYQQFVKDVIVDRKIPIQKSIKKNSLPLFKRSQPKGREKIQTVGDRPEE